MRMKKLIHMNNMRFKECNMSIQYPKRMTLKIEESK